MKNNRKYLIVVAMFLLLAVVLFMGGSTYAKYVTQKDVATEQATVAKWGYVITANTENFFGRDYTKDDKNTATVVADNEGKSISASTATITKVVAPGASGSMTLTISGQAEVLSKITFTVTGGFDENGNCKANADAIQLTKVNGTNLDPVYEPIEWTVTNDGSTELDDFSGSTLNDLEGWLEGLNVKFASVNPNQAIEIKLTISWKWAFDGNYNEYDTILGDLENGIKCDAEGNVVTKCNRVMNFNLNVTVEQIQDQSQDQNQD